MKASRLFVGIQNARLLRMQRGPATPSSALNPSLLANRLNSGEFSNVRILVNLAP